MSSSDDDYSGWLGRTESVVDEISPAAAAAAAATLDQDPQAYGPGAELPPLWHWFYFLAKAPQSQLGDDGHPLRNARGFLPPMPFPRRMFAGARLTWQRPLVVGRPARREAEILKIAKKTGRRGGLAFVTVAYRVFQSDALCLEEQQDIVYREPGPPLVAPEPCDLPAVPDGAWTRVVTPDTRLLFRFSALTFNAHRIHYDRPYAIDEEGYPGLVVHGPLTAMLLLRLALDHTTQPIASFSFRGQAPLFDLAPFRLVGMPAGGNVNLEAQGPDAQTAMTATAEFRR